MPVDPAYAPATTDASPGPDRARFAGRKSGYPAPGPPTTSRPSLSCWRSSKPALTLALIRRAFADGNIPAWTWAQTWQLIPRHGDFTVKGNRWRFAPNMRCCAP